MTFEAAQRRAAIDDLDEAYRWYEAQRTGLGAEFLGAVDDAVTEIVSRPVAKRVIHRNVRRILLRRFPYGLFYVAENAAVVVIACFHVRQDPARWRAPG